MALRHRRDWTGVPARVGSFGWILRDRESRRSAVNRELELATREAGEARTRALLVVRNPGDWERALGEALAAFERAEVIASQNPALLNSATSTRMAAMRGTLADDLKDRRFAELVDEIRLGVSDTYLEAGEYMLFQQEVAFPKTCCATRSNSILDCPSARRRRTTYSG